MQASPLLVAGISSTTAILVVLLQASLNRIAAKRAEAKLSQQLFLPERRSTYESLVEAHSDELSYLENLRAVALRVLEGSQNHDDLYDELSQDQSMQRLVNAVEQVRRVSIDMRVIQASEDLLRSHADALTLIDDVLTVGKAADLSVKIALRMLRVRAHIFVWAYREELGIGVPKGAVAPIAAKEVLDRDREILMTHRPRRVDEQPTEEEATDEGP